MSAKRYSCIWPQAGHVIFPFCSAASLTNIEKTLPQILQESSTLISIILPLRRFGLSEMLQRDSLPNSAGNRGICVVSIRTKETNSTNHYYQNHSKHNSIFSNIIISSHTPEV